MNYSPQDRSHRQMPATKIVLALFCSLVIAMSPVASKAEETKVKLAEGKIVLSAPESWERKEPRTRIVEVEFAVPAPEGDSDPARLTMMASGGGVEANIDRWIGQFTQPDKQKTTRDVTKIEKQKIAGVQVHVVDITGNFKDQPRGPFGPTVMKEKFRMLAAIIETKSSGTYYIKLYGPAETIHGNADGFKAMLKSLELEN